MTQNPIAVIVLNNWRLPTDCSPNKTTHWSKKSKARKTLRQIGWGEARKQCPGVRFERAKIGVSLRVCRNTREWAQAPGYRPRDEDNALAALKGFFDGIVEAGVVPDDNAKYLQQAGVRLTTVPRVQDESLLVVISELEEVA